MHGCISVWLCRCPPVSCQEHLWCNAPLKGLKVVVNAGHGGAGFIASHVLTPLGADVSGSLYLTPDGHFPAHPPPRPQLPFKPPPWTPGPTPISSIARLPAQSVCPVILRRLPLPVFLGDWIAPLPSWSCSYATPNGRPLVRRCSSMHEQPLLVQQPDFRTSDDMHFSKWPAPSFLALEQGDGGKEAHL